ncbi:MAG: serine/threonine-protein kinase [Kiritimatiellaeota bacterium]|nr:serine/threonine-protein kinase [Kiritimatiellota bacterium]
MNDQTPDNSCSSEAAPVIEGYRVLENLGHGATSSVWKAEQVSLNRLVVIKVLSERLTQEPEDVTLFKAEARMAANFKHAGIVQVYDFGQSKTGRRYYFVMEYISGYSVGDWIRRKGKITEHEALVVAQAVADALKYAWDLSRIVHCDIKPDNIMVDGDGSIKVADLGLAHTVKTMANQPGVDANEVIITGTPNYMAPEQVRGSDPIDCRTDIYALGASLYHMVTGQLPFGDSPPEIVLERQLQEAFAYPQQVNPDLSTSTTRLILKMTAKEPNARFQTWDEVLTEVVRLERQMRKQAAAAAALAERVPAADSKKDAALAGDGQKCRYCGKSIQPQALYCGFCGKPVAIPAKEPDADRKQGTIRLKPIQANPPVSNKSVAPPPVQPMPRPRSASGHKHSTWSGNVCMVLSLCLLTFLGYYTYQKVRYDNNVIIPIKTAIIQAVPPMLEQSLQGIQAGARWIYDLFMSRPPPPVDLPKAAPKSELQPTESTATTETKASSSKAQGDSAAEFENFVKSDTNVEPATASSAPTPVPEKSAQEMEWERLLAQCKQQQPKAGERVTITFNNQQKKVEIILDHVAADGVMAKVPPGLVEYPFRLMSEESRLMFFPEERARQLQRQQAKKSE